MAVKHPLTNKANKYARDIVSGKIKACELIKLQCQKHLDDLAKEKNANFPYRFDKAAAEKFCTFAELMPHVKGEWKGTLIILEPWQCFFFAIPFGWVRKKDGLRRYREIDAEIPRKNAKSTMAAIIGLYMAFVDGEPGSEVYSGAATEKQAHEVFAPAWKMVKYSPGFKKRFNLDLSGTEKNPGTIYSMSSGSKFEAVVGKPGDGASVHCGIVDEFHEHQTDHTYDCFNTGMGSRSQPMLVVVTTAGTNTASPCYNLRTQAIKILKGERKDETVFVMIFTIDPAPKVKDGEEKPPEPWTIFENWITANPNYGVSIFEDYMKAQHATAIADARKQNILKCKHCNIWSNAADAYFNMVDFALCGDPTLNILDFAEQPVYIGMDLAAKKDLCARMRLFKRGDDYYLFSHYYLPSSEVVDEENAHYAGWAHDDYIELHQGNRIDLNSVQEDIEQDAKDFDVTGEENGGGEVCNDPWNAQQMVSNLMNKDIEVTEIVQQSNILSEPMKEIDALIADGKFHHDANPVTFWCFANTMATPDKKDNVFPFKSAPQNKIDGALATMNAMCRAMVTEISECNGNDGSLMDYDWDDWDD
jgi:phage terminase large subunit-like protein